jgi:drug/metabolite transporter (DMT)-like permease
MGSEGKSLLLGGLSVLFWSTVATAFKIALNYYRPEQMLVLASLFSSLILFFILIISKKIKLLWSLKAKQILVCILIGFLNPFLYYLVLFKAYSLLPAQEALSLNYTWAIVLTILSSIFQKRRISLFSYFALLLSFFGVLVIISKGSLVTLKPSNAVGATLALSSSLIWGFSWIINVVSKIEDEIRLFLNFAFGAIFSFSYLLYCGDTNLPFSVAIFSTVYIGAFEMGITFVLWNKALKNASNPGRINNLIYASPLLSLVFISFVLKEEINFSTVVGILLIVGGILLQNLPLINRELFRKAIK